MIGFASVSLLVLLFIFPGIQHPALFIISGSGIALGIFQYIQASRQRSRIQRQVNRSFKNFEDNFKRW